MKTGPTIALIAVAAAAIGFTVLMVDVDQTQEAALPEVSVEGGQMPEFDVETGSIDVGTDTATVTVPDVDVTVDTEQAEVTVPSIDITPPDDNEG